MLTLAVGVLKEGSNGPHLATHDISTQQPIAQKVDVESWQELP